VSHSSEFCRHNPLCCFSTSVFVSVYFVIDSVRKLFDTPSYINTCKYAKATPQNCD